MNKKCYHEEKGTNFNNLHNAQPDPDCTCDVGTTGPAKNIKEEPKAKGTCYHNDKGVSFNDLHNAKPNPDCTCDVGVTGSAKNL